MFVIALKYLELKNELYTTTSPYVDIPYVDIPYVDIAFKQFIGLKYKVTYVLDSNIQQNVLFWYNTGSRKSFILMMVWKCF